MSTSTPLLSICIPTYNRAELLRRLLVSLLPQVKEFNGEVEIVISDNASPDHTQDIIEWAQAQYPIRYSKNPENLGAVRNALKSVELTQGEFAWMIGDDDMVLKGRLRTVVEHLRKHRDLDYIFVNHVIEPNDLLDKIVYEMDSTYDPDPSHCLVWDFESRILPKYENVMFMDGLFPPMVFGSIGGNLFRRSVWFDHVDKLDMQEDTKDFSSLGMILPYLIILAYPMVGRPIYFIGTPCVVKGEGTQDWMPRYGMSMWSSHVYDGIELYSHLGVASQIIKRIREHSLKVNETLLPIFFSGDPIVQGREYFSLSRFIRHNIQFPIRLSKLLYRVYMQSRVKNLYSHLPQPLQKSWRLVKRSIKLLTGKKSDPNSVEFLRQQLPNLPRYQTGEVNYGAWTIEYVDAPAMLSSISVLLESGWNDFTYKGDNPTILDCGANIGISVLRYKQLFPNAKIIAFEPDQEISAVLRRNLERNQVHNVEVVQAAVWTENGEMTFHAEGADGSRLVVGDNSDNQNTYTVRTIDLNDYLDTPVDFIKLDIEGAETQVLLHCAEKLSSVGSMIVEYHHYKDETQSLIQILDVLQKAGFKYMVNSLNHVDLRNTDIIYRTKQIDNFDQYLLICAWHPED